MNANCGEFFLWLAQKGMAPHNLTAERQRGYSRMTGLFITNADCSR